MSFKLYYGAAPSEAAALASLATVGATSYALAQPSTPDGKTQGTPTTFVIGVNPCNPVR